MGREKKQKMSKKREYKNREKAIWVELLYDHAG